MYSHIGALGLTKKEYGPTGHFLIHSLYISLILAVQCNYNTVQFFCCTILHIDFKFPDLNKVEIKLEIKFLISLHLFHIIPLLPSLTLLLI